MAPPPPSLDYWRGFFNGARASIFDAIDAAIRVAAADCPDGLRAQRDAIAHRLFTVLPPSEEEPAPAMVAVAEPPPTLPEGFSSVPSLCSSDGAAVAHRRDSDDPVAAEVFRVKAALSSNQQMSEDELLQLLRSLQQLKFTVDTIKVTEIVKAVKQLPKHGSKQIRQLVRSLIEGWQAMVATEWMSNEDAIVDHTPQSDASSLEQEEGGLPSPPMDEVALFATLTPCSSMQLSEFFDEMDDDGNIRTDAKESEQQSPANQESIKKQPPVVQQYDPVENWKLDQSAVRQLRLCGSSGWQQPITEAQEKPSTAAFGPGRPHRLHSEPSETRPKQLQDISVAQTQRRPKPTMANQSLTSPHDQNSVRAKLELAKSAKLEATKRKLQEGYQEFGSAKQQRTIQMLDLQDLPMPKQGNRSLQTKGKARNNSTGNIGNRPGIRL